MSDQEILLALQPETSADALVEQAVIWAEQLGMRLDLCTVLPTFISADPLHAVGSARDKSEAAVADQQRILAWLEDLVADLPEGCRGSAALLMGDAQTEINAKAESYRLLMVGTHHRRDLTRLLLGSVAESLVRTAPVPVLVLATNPRELHDPPRVHLPVDPGEPNFHAVEWATTHLPNADLKAVYLLPWVEIFGPMQPAGDIAMSEAAERLRVALSDGGHGDLEGVVVVREETNVGEALAHEAHTGKVDLIAMPTHGRTGVARLLLGSVSERVVRASDCAVLVVR